MIFYPSENLKKDKLDKTIRPPKPNQVDWISLKVGRNIPPYGMWVWVCRPNPFTGEKDSLMGKLCPADPNGVYYGKIGNPNQKITFDDYWIAGRANARVFRFDKITAWALIPDPPKY